MQTKTLSFLTATFSLTSVFADTLTLTNGSTVKGVLQSADNKEIRLQVGEEVKAYPLSEVTTLVIDKRETPGPSRITSGTIVVRTIDAIDSKTAQVGQTFRASLDEPADAGGAQIPRGGDAVLRLVEARSAGKLRGNAALSVMLVSISSNGKVYEVNSENVSVESGGKGKGSATKVGVGAGAGAVLGGVLAGKRGAVIGAGAGAGAGTAVALATGPQVRIPSETKLSFRLQ